MFDPLRDFDVVACALTLEAHGLRTQVTLEGGAEMALVAVRGGGFLFRHAMVCSAVEDDNRFRASYACGRPAAVASRGTLESVSARTLL